MKATDIFCATVTVERVMYPKEFEPGDWAIIKCNIVQPKKGTPYDDSGIVVKGKVLSAAKNITYYMEGKFERNATYGDAYILKEFREQKPITEGEKDLYLRAVMTEAQYELLGNLPDPYGVLERGDIKALESLRGVGERNAQKLLERFRSHIDMANLYGKLQNWGLTPTAINNLLNQYHSSELLLHEIEMNPYILVEHAKGIGWAKADDLALNMGVGFRDIRRVKAYILYYLRKITEAGDMWSTPQEIWNNASFDLHYDAEEQPLVRDALNALLEEKHIWVSEDRKRLGLAKLRELEERVATQLHRIASGPVKKPTGDVEAIIRRVEQQKGIEFTEEQRKAIYTTLNNNVVIITGQAGTGKSSAVAGIIACLKETCGSSFAQCALAGRAAARLGEVTGFAGSTIHRLIGLNAEANVPTHNLDNPLEEDIIILDEVSMVGLDIFVKLLEAINTGSRLIMLGDDGQLESIGLGNVFYDMLNSGRLNVCRLTKIHRQAAKSAIITESAKVRRGEQICDQMFIGKQIRGEYRDLELNVFNDSILTFDTVINHYWHLLKEGVDKADIQIIVPMKMRGEACTYRLNAKVQEIVNPNEKQSLFVKTPGETGVSYRLKLNDQVICTKNMYDTMKAELGVVTKDQPVCAVFNGDRGVVKAILPKELQVDFEQWGLISIPIGLASNIELGYALSCHKLQGSEAKYVIIGIDSVSSLLLCKEWLYTALTRAKKYCVLCAESKALQYAIKTSHVPQKRTLLRELLVQKFS